VSYERIRYKLKSFWGILLCNLHDNLWQTCGTCGRYIEIFAKIKQRRWRHNSVDNSGFCVCESVWMCACLVKSVYSLNDILSRYVVTLTLWTWFSFYVILLVVFIWNSFNCFVNSFIWLWLFTQSLMLCLSVASLCSRIPDEGLLGRNIGVYIKRSKMLKEVFLFSLNLLLFIYLGICIAPQNPFGRL
jgi:hypothetical protein